jgi:hypothetical protein
MLERHVDLATKTMTLLHEFQYELGEFDETNEKFELLSFCKEKIDACEKIQKRFWKYSIRQG